MQQQRGLNYSGKKMIAWGAGPLLEIFTGHYPDHGFACCIDSASELHGSNVNGLKIVPPEMLSGEDKKQCFVVITAFSSAAIQSIQSVLSDKGFILGEDFADLAFLLKDALSAKPKTSSGRLSQTSFSFLPGRLTSIPCFLSRQPFWATGFCWRHWTPRAIWTGPWRRSGHIRGATPSCSSAPCPSGRTAAAISFSTLSRAFPSFRVMILQTCRPLTITTTKKGKYSMPWQDIRRPR